MIPVADPRAGYLAQRAEIDAAIARVLAGGRYIMGEEVAAFEREFARWVGAREAAAVANGTDALRLALAACGVGPGDEVVTVAHTAVATVAAIELLGATPVLVDVDETTATLDPRALDAATGPRTKAIVPVHIYGHPADMDAIGGFAAERRLAVVEDCAQAHGARWKGRAVGTFGAAAAFSFYPTKNLGALGDGGAVVTSDPEIARRVRLLREYGWAERYVSHVPGMNSRLDEIQAAVLRVRLGRLDADNARRAELARGYEVLADLGLEIPRTRAGATPVFHLYVVRSPHRDELAAFLGKSGVGSLVHYPVPVHLQPAYAGRVSVAGRLDVTEKLARSVLSLPLHPHLADGDQTSVVDAVRAFVRR